MRPRRKADPLATMPPVSTRNPFNPENKSLESPDIEVKSIDVVADDETDEDQTHGE